MNNVISLLEKMGSCASFKDNELEVMSEIETTELSDELREALVNKNTGALETILERKSKIYCLLFPAEDDDAESESEGETPDESDDKQESNIRVSA